MHIIGKIEHEREAPHARHTDWTREDEKGVAHIVCLRISKKKNNKKPLRWGYFRPWIFWSCGQFCPEPILLFAKSKILFFAENRILMTASTKNIVSPQKCPYRRNFVRRIRICHHKNHRRSQFQNNHKNPIFILAPTGSVFYFSEISIWSNRLQKWILHIKQD